MQIKKTTITLRDMRFFSFHGVLPEERKEGGWYTVSVNMEMSHCNAVVSDDLRETVDYSKVFEIVAHEMDIPSDLIEHVAGKIAKTVLAAFSLIESITVTVQKDKPPIEGAVMGGASVKITAKR